MPKTLHIHLHLPRGDEEAARRFLYISRQLTELISQGKALMATTEEIKAKVAELEAEQAETAREVGEAVATLQELKAALDAAIAAGGSAADLQDISDRLAAVTAKFAATRGELDTAGTANDPTP